jgi:hypothetical protein
MLVEACWAWSEVAQKRQALHAGIGNKCICYQAEWELEADDSRAGWGPGEPLRDEGSGLSR